ncbi:MAG TPA: aldehyde dehydrogenase (NADP(+)) [Bryobacteraceae bacterium]|nr:aldehyde dehydrogenase (NADP(+)) [Bryobacteraceae bacterium]
MTLQGKNLIGGQEFAGGSKQIFAFDPKRGQQLPTPYFEATDDEIQKAMDLAEEAFAKLRESSATVIAGFLEAIAAEVEGLGDELIDLASTESGLGKERVSGERARTVGQLRLFASLVKEGSFVDARIDTALPDRKPIPRPDLRRMLIPIGPVVVFGASNFPLAFSVAGGDTASAFAAKNPVIVKAHPAHPGTSELVAGAISRAVQKAHLPPGTFSLLHAADPAVSLKLVRHPIAKAVAFTGSERAGRAIFDAAAQRPSPIPAYVEMGSNNPVFVLPGALRSAGNLAQNLFGSVNLGVGQFCTSPGVVVGQNGDAFKTFGENLERLFEQGAPGTMLHPGILKGYSENVEKRAKTSGVTTIHSSKEADASKTEALPVLFETDARTWLNQKDLAAEIFGPSTMLVRWQSKEELLRIAKEWSGTLTASVFGTPADLEDFRDLIAVLETKAGRVLFNSFPTGVEVSAAMHHGGPYPATADPKFTSVGTAAILRFLRPVCYQNFPEAALPIELQNENKRRIWRMINGELTRDSIPG